MLVAQRRVLEDRMRELEGHIAYLDRKIEYWSAIQAGDRPRAAEIVEEVLCRVNSTQLSRQT
jgi:hypothetical protein